jgi:hypothetical protein
MVLGDAPSPFAADSVMANRPSARPTPADYLSAARVPGAIAPQVFFPWTIERRMAGVAAPGEIGLSPEQAGWPDYTLLRKLTMASLHLEHIGGEVVMEDSRRELRKHLPFWLTARGRALKTGLGLGCVVRGLLVNPDVEHIDVVEIDEQIIRVIGSTFAGNPRVTIHHADALAWDFGARTWDCAWHDISTDGDIGLQAEHAKLIRRYWPAVKTRQGAWGLPREVTRCLPFRLIGAAKPRRALYQTAHEGNGSPGERLPQTPSRAA